MPAASGMNVTVDKAYIENLIRSILPKYVDTSVEGFDMDEAVKGVMLILEVVVSYIQYAAIATGVQLGAGIAPIK